MFTGPPRRTNSRLPRAKTNTRQKGLQTFDQMKKDIVPRARAERDLRNSQFPPPSSQANSRPSSRSVAGPGNSTQAVSSIPTQVTHKATSTTSENKGESSSAPAQLSHTTISITPKRKREASEPSSPSLFLDDRPATGYTEFCALVNATLLNRLVCTNIIAESKEKITLAKKRLADNQEQRTKLKEDETQLKEHKHKLKEQWDETARGLQGKQPLSQRAEPLEKTLKLLDDELKVAEVKLARVDIELRVIEKSDQRAKELKKEGKKEMEDAELKIETAYSTWKMARENLSDENRKKWVAEAKLRGKARAET